MENLGTLDDLLHVIHSVADTPKFQKHLKTPKLTELKQRKPEWGQPIEILVPNTNPPTLIAFDAKPPSSDNVRAAIHLIQSPNPALPVPTCESFRIILRLMLDPGRLHLLNGTTLLSSCIRLLCEHVKDTGEPMFRYEYGYLCFQAIVLTVQMAIICRAYSGGFETFKSEAIFLTRKDTPELITAHAIHQIEICKHKPTNERISWILQTATTPKSGRTFLPAVGGFTEVDSAFLLKEMWKSRKQFSYIGAKMPTYGWSFVLQLIGEHMLEGILEKKHGSVMWGYLETLCNRCVLVSRYIEINYLSDAITISTRICTENSENNSVRGLVDEQDARVVVESYIARMTPQAGLAPLSAGFCATLVDFVFHPNISTLGEVLVPLVKVTYERVWMDLMDEVEVRVEGWCVGFIQYVYNILECTKRLFGAEHMFKQTEIESFFQVLHDIDIIGLIGQTILMPINLQLKVEVPPCWAQVLEMIISYGQTLAYSKSTPFASQLFEAQYTDWLNTMSYIRHQILHETSQERLLRNNAPGCELAWKSIGKIFGFTKHVQQEGGAQGRGVCSNPRCAMVSESQMVCERCYTAEYCSQLCQNTHWKLYTLDSHKVSCEEVLSQPRK